MTISKEAIEAMRPHIEKLKRCVPINDEMGRVVTGQTEAITALAEIFDKAEAALPFLSPIARKPDMLRLAVAAVLEADKEFRANMPPEWEGDPLSDEIDGLRRVFSSTLPIAVEGKVKALEWEDEGGEYIAQSVIGWFHIGRPASYWNLTTPHGTVISHETLDEAKAAAQADYTARILSALTSSPGKVLGYVREAGLRSLAERNHTSIYPSPDEERGYTIPVYAQPASTAQEVEAVKYEARICKGVPADCCDYGVVDLEEGIEVCRVWKEADARLIADLLNGTVWPEPTEDGDDLTECFRHHVRTAIGWQAFGARPGPEMHMYEEGFKAGYRRCQSDNEPEFGEEEDALDARARKVIGRLRDSLKAGGVEQIDIDNAVDLIIDQAKSLTRPQPASTALVERLGLAWAAVGHHEGIEISVHADAADTWNALCAILDPLARSALSASQSTKGDADA